MAAAQRRDARAVSRCPTPPGNGSILWRVFTVNAIVFGAAVSRLRAAPPRCTRRSSLSELIDADRGAAVHVARRPPALLALVLAPVRRLAQLMGDIDPMRPGLRADGQRLAVGGG